MHKAALDNNTDLISYLIETLKFDLHDTDLNGNTALHYACKEGHDKAISLLIALGSNVNT